MTLCRNRPEGFGPHSNLHPSLPTTCFIDVIVVPLATWIYLLAAAILLAFLFLRHRRSASSPSSFTPHDNEKAHGRKRNVWRTIGRVLYYFFIIALIAMISLEIARLVDAQLGVGLLPFMYPGILLAAGLHFWMGRKNNSSSGFRLVKSVNALYWLMLVVVFAIKVATYVKQGVNSRNNMAPEDNYKVSDEVTDVSVMIFVAAMLMILEIATN